MKKIIIVLAILSFLFSCDKEETKYLYDENDPEYAAFVLAAQQKCITESSFFTTFDTYGEFDNAIFKQDKIYKIVQDANAPVVTYVKVNLVNANDVSLIFSSNTNSLDKILIFEESDHVSIGNFLKPAVCSSTYNEYFSSISGKDSTTNLKFSWFKETISTADDDDEDTEPEVYDRITDALNVNLNYPSFFYFYNGTKTHKYIQDNTDDAKEESTESKIVITDVTDSEECDNDGDSDATNCTTAAFNAVTRNCSLEVDEDAYKLRPHTTKVISLSGDADCNNALMKSNGGI